jgi:hypothetical protein
MMHVETNGGRGTASEPPSSTGKARGAEAAIDEGTIAAIAMALDLESQPEARKIAVDRRTSVYALAGRARVMRGR